MITWPRGYYSMTHIPWSHCTITPLDTLWFYWSGEIMWPMFCVTIGQSLVTILTGRWWWEIPLSNSALERNRRGISREKRAVRSEQGLIGWNKIMGCGVFLIHYGNDTTSIIRQRISYNSENTVDNWHARYQTNRRSLWKCWRLPTVNDQRSTDNTL